MVIKRDLYLNKLISKRQNGRIKVITGLRRSGKSYLLFNLFKSYLLQEGTDQAHIIEIQFDDFAFKKYRKPEEAYIFVKSQIKDSDQYYIFLDEVQLLEEFENVLNGFLHIPNADVFVTGSNAKLLSSDLATHLTGRSSEIPLYPFSFSEYCEMKDVDTTTLTTEKIAFRREAFDNYMKQGGFPELMQIKNAKQYISNLVSNILTRDIEQRYKITYKAEFEAMSHHLLNVSPTVINTCDLAKIFSFKSDHTVSNYIKYLKQAYLLIGVKKYSAKSKVRSTMEKVYPVDIALMNQREDALAGENLGWRLETTVLNHLIRKCKVDGMDVYYLNERYGECDFVVCKGNKVVQCIQVSYDITSNTTRKREINGLLLAAKRTKCDNLLLLTDHQYEETEADGKKIKIQPVYEWCIENSK